MVKHILGKNESQVRFLVRAPTNVLQLNCNCFCTINTYCIMLAII